jgi:hypothetical protein
LCRQDAMVEPLGFLVKLGWLNRGIVWVPLRRLEPIRHKRGLLGGCDAHTGVKPQWVRYKLDETIEQPCSDCLTHTSEV